MEEEQETLLQFEPWHSAPDITFWQKLAALKLDKLQLNDAPQNIFGFYSVNRSQNIPSRLLLHMRPCRERGEHFEWEANGTLYNANTLQAFKNLDKARLLEDAKDNILGIIRRKDYDVQELGRHLNSFIVCTFADLKQHTFVYWFGFPALIPQNSFIQTQPPVKIFDEFENDEVQSLRSQFRDLARADKQNSIGTRRTFRQLFVIQRHKKRDSKISIHVMDFCSWFKNFCHKEESAYDYYFGFVDPCGLAMNPGWPLRNYLALLGFLHRDHADFTKKLKIFSFRDIDVLQEKLNSGGFLNSLIFSVRAPAGSCNSIDSYRVVGWEANIRGKFGPRLINLSSHMDPIRLAEASANLNLKLMRWRQLPTLDLDIIAKTKCLLLGAGTLGCYTARSLLSWGFRHITLLDNSIVSYSNPVRQPLFEFKDCGKPKAECAAEALKRIYPLVHATGVNISIPMAGHVLSNPELIEECKDALSKLTDLIDAHDVIFLGTDSRESRWLPTVIAASKQKLVINSALGFDSYLVMRHGLYDDNGGEKLGCYFCNDVVGPRNSLQDRTMDQMCTVTRPGLAPIASALAVELLVAYLHKKHIRAVDQTSQRKGRMNYIPHQLRGFLDTFTVVPITGAAFDKCTACSRRVVAMFEAAPFGLLRRACDDSQYLEELTGLQDLISQVDALGLEAMECSDEEL